MSSHVSLTLDKIGANITKQSREMNNIRNYGPSADVDERSRIASMTLVESVSIKSGHTFKAEMKVDTKIYTFCNERIEEARGSTSHGCHHPHVRISNHIANSDKSTSHCNIGIHVKLLFSGLRCATANLEVSVMPHKLGRDAPELEIRFCQNAVIPNLLCNNTRQEHERSIHSHLYE
ncbi:hypothetical protein PanWU01x14_039520 [Parasponia andersonii]|uniref:Uncharacterized protein n=1 Tax=Parasponia andersonii TaxID=3476 RepID=A0A2P5DQX3_PARAD|nr:hypothetical protein PanWU01x14_039520 [Parasponia andersonii]